MRCVSAIAPCSSCGTLKSTRISTRLPCKSIASIASFAMSLLSDHVLEQVHAAIRVTPLVVVPADELEESAVQLDAAARVKNARMRVVNEVARHHLIGGVRENALEV